MSTFIERLQSELDELHIKISKLDSFIDSDFMGADISKVQTRLLKKQLGIMREYSSCLQDRLVDLNK